MRPAVCEKGGFITTTVGRTSSGRMLCSCEASSVKIRSRDERRTAARSSARRGLSSFRIICAGRAFAASTAMLPVPALGSITRSVGRMSAAQAMA